MNILDIAKQLNETTENLILMYAFNSTGKTRLSVAYKDYTKLENDGRHVGVYYNAYSEDLFVWENDEENDNTNISLKINHSNLNRFHSYMDVTNVEEKLAAYRPKYKFRFNLYDNTEKGIESITFFIDEEDSTPIKISRGEERIFIWCFFLVLFEIDAWVGEGEQDVHFFIDDPVSSLDEHNIFITAESIFNLIEEHYLTKKIIITTHHIGLFSILFNKLNKSEKSGRYKKLTKSIMLATKKDQLELKDFKKEVFLFHLHLMQTLNEAIVTNDLYVHHFVLLRQLLENIASFLGEGRTSFVLEQIGVEEIGDISDRINSLSHRNVYYPQPGEMNEADQNMFKEIFGKLQSKYNFSY